MAKVSFTKLGLSKNQEVKEVKFNEQIIEVKQYLPVNDKLMLISDVINMSMGENNFANPVQVSVFTTIGILEYYTNINFTEKQKEDPAKLYDLVISNDFASKIVDAIPEEEYEQLIDGIEDSIEAYYNYRNSVMGILDTVSHDYSNLNLDASKIQKELGDPNNMALLREVLTKLG